MTRKIVREEQVAEARPAVAQAESPAVVNVVASSMKPTLPKVETKSMVIKYPAAAAIRRTGTVLILASGRDYQKVSVQPCDKVTCEVTIERGVIENKMVTIPAEVKNEQQSDNAVPV